MGSAGKPGLGHGSLLEFGAVSEPPEHRGEKWETCLSPKGNSGAVIRRGNGCWMAEQYPISNDRTEGGVDGFLWG